MADMAVSCSHISRHSVLPRKLVADLHQMVGKVASGRKAEVDHFEAELTAVNELLTEILPNDAGLKMTFYVSGLSTTSTEELYQRERDKKSWSGSLTFIKPEQMLETDMSTIHSGLVGVKVFETCLCVKQEKKHFNPVTDQGHVREMVGCGLTSEEIIQKTSKACSIALDKTGGGG